MNRADRRFRRQRKINRAKKMLRMWGIDEKHAPLWADNMAKCGCWMCSGSARHTRPETEFDDNIDQWVKWAKEWE